MRTDVRYPTTMKPDELAKQLAVARKECGLSQPELGKLLELSTTSVWKIESGNTTVMHRKVEEWARVTHRRLVVTLLHTTDPDDMMLADLIDTPADERREVVSMARKLMRLSHAERVRVLGYALSLVTEGSTTP